MSDLTLMVCGAGITFLITTAEKGELIRTFLARWEYTRNMLECSFCTGVWVGMFLWLTVSEHTVYQVLLWPVFACGVGIVSMVLGKVIDACEAIVYGSGLLTSFIPDDQEKK